MLYTADLGQLNLVPSVPPPSGAAPTPVLLGDEGLTLLLYIGIKAHGQGPSTTGNPPSYATVVVKFKGCRACYFGSPNEEAYAGHPLARRGFQPHRVFEVVNSSWIRKLESMNRVHPRHNPESFGAYRHFIFAFQDSTFECVATELEVAELPLPYSEAVQSVVAQFAASPR